MTYSIVHNLVRLLILLVVQVLLCNNIHIFGYATPLLITYVLISMEKGTGRVSLLLWGFFTGLLYDMFSNTAGMASAGMTLLAMVLPEVLASFCSHDEEEHIIPSASNMGFWSFAAYTFMCMFVVHAVFYLLDAFMLSNFRLTLLSTFAGTVLATVLALFVDMIVNSSKD